MSFPKYPEYKSCSIQWTGDIPAHWETLALKRIVLLKSGNTISPDKITVEGEYPVYGGNGLRGYTDAYTHEGFFPLVGRQGALCGNVNYASGRFWASEHAVVTTALRPLEPKWLGELLRAMNLGQHSVSAAQPGLSVEIINNLHIPLPPLPEQSAIAAFLDRETAKIDALVAEQEKLIELLKEKRQAGISHAVIKGLDPNVRMKDSCVEWLGEVPEHWVVCPLRRLLASIEQGSSPQSEANPATPGEPAIIKLSAIKNGYFEATENKALDSMQSVDPRYEVRPNDLLVTRANTLDLVGASCIVHSNIPEKLFLPDLVYRLSLRSEMTPQFLNYFFQGSSARSQISADARGSSMTMAKISQGHIKCWWVTLPPRAEQDQITSFLEGENRQFDGLMDEAQRAIDLLKERRSALISAAVTGKIDVRGLCPQMEVA